VQSGGSLRCVSGRNDQEFPCCGLELCLYHYHTSFIPDHSKAILGHFFLKHTSKSLHFASLHRAIQVDKVDFFLKIITLAAKMDHGSVSD
jgi:hypothetical protein